MHRIGTALFTCSVIIVSGCATPNQYRENDEKQSVTIENSILSYGMAKKHLINNTTTQSDVIKLFGSPNNMTYSPDGCELWIYDQVFYESTTVIDKTSSGFSVGAANSSSAAGFNSRGNQTSLRQTGGVRTLTVILEFNKEAVLINHSVRSGGYR